MTSDIVAAVEGADEEASPGVNVLACWNDAAMFGVFYSCVPSMTCLDLSNSRCLMPNVSEEGWMILSHGFFPLILSL